MSGSSTKKKVRPVKMLSNDERKLAGIVAEGDGEYYSVRTVSISMNSPILKTWRDYSRPSLNKKSMIKLYEGYVNSEQNVHYI